MIRSAPALLCLAIVAAPDPALATRGTDDDAPIPYSNEKDDEAEWAPAPGRSNRRPELRESEDEESDRDQSRAGFDDPNVGLSAELLLGLMLIDSSRGALVESRLAWGARLTWEWGRVLRDEILREALFADLTWSYSAIREGTEEVFGDSNYHAFTLAPAFAIPFGRRSPFALYAQLGGGFGYQFSSLHLLEGETQIAGTKPIIQYGIGLRARPAIAADQSLRFSFRFELTRFRRGYMDDTFLGGSLGATF